MMPVPIIGVMSGSSLDGLDIALCQFDEEKGILTWKIQEAKTVFFPEHIYQSLKSTPSLNGFDLMKLDADFGKYIGVQIKTWVDQLSLRADYIASHGHTVFHEPLHGFTTQIGSGAHIVFETGIDTITTFRQADIAAGGQGAPFAPAADKILFPGYEAYLNLGGIANINLLTNQGQWKAWDIGPCNQALNYLAAKAGQQYDEDGKMAASGIVLPYVVDALLAMYPFNEGKPKGLSNAEVLSTWIHFLEICAENPINLLASVTEAIGRMVIDHVSPLNTLKAKILITGGGAHNQYLIKRLNALSADIAISFHYPSASIIDYKECLLMAYLGYLTMQRRTYQIKDITGASTDTIGGAIFKATR